MCFHSNKFRWDKKNKSNNKSNRFECFWLTSFVFFNCTPIQFSEMEVHFLSLVIQNWYFMYKQNLLQIYAQVCSTWTFCNNSRTYLDSTLPHLSYYSACSLNSCKNEEYILFGQIFYWTLPIFQSSNVQLQHKSGQTCLMTDRYLHHWNLHLISN